MSAPFRISKPKVAQSAMQTGAVPLAAAKDEGSSYIQRLVLMIPAEVVTLYLAGLGVVPLANSPIVVTVWAAICLGLVVLFRALGTRDAARKLKPDWLHVTISSIAFVIWVFIIGRPLNDWNVSQPSWVGYMESLIALAWTAIVPAIYEGPME